MEKYDVIIAGGGMSGVAAAIAAAREGLKVLLVEKNYGLGGAANSCLINPFMKYYIEQCDKDGNKQLIQLNNGIFGQIVSRIRKMGGMDETDLLNPVFNEEYLKYVLENMCEEADIEVLYGTMVTSAEVSDRQIRSIQIYNRDGFSTVSAPFYIDCTGDANLSVQVGVPFRLGRPGDHLCQPMTLCFWIGNVDREQFRKIRPQINPLYKKFQQEGRIRNTRENVLIFHHIAPDVLHFNTTRVINLNPTDAKDVTKAQFEARKQVFEMYGFLKENFECFRNSVLLMTAAEIGVRESRMIDGEYLYTQEDILNYTVFEDSIACGCYEIDIHNPSGTGTHLIYLDRNKYYTIPYRCLIPQGIKNLLVAGRCISSTHEAQSAYRIMPIVCNLGEGAGTAIACAFHGGTDTRGVDIREVHRLLDRYGMRYR